MGREKKYASCCICGGKHVSRGFCDWHFHVERSLGRLPNQGACKAEGCDKFGTQTGLCIWCKDKARRQAPAAKAKKREYDSIRRVDLIAREQRRIARRARRQTPKGKEVRRTEHNARNHRIREATLPNHLPEVNAIYEKCPTGKVIDHIIPLFSKDVCGLHVPWNLQALTPEENSTKQNKIDLKAESANGLADIRKKS